MREVLVVYNLDKMNSVSESSRMDDFKSEKKNNAITNQSVLMNPITKEKKPQTSPVVCCLKTRTQIVSSMVSSGVIHNKPINVDFFNVFCGLKRSGGCLSPILNLLKLLILSEMMFL